MLTKMFRCALVILLVNYYNYGSGSPVPAPKNNSVQLAKILHELAESCTNNFLKTQINNKIEECDKEAFQPYDQHTLKCMLFYDVNRRLCSDDEIVKKNIKDHMGNINEDKVSVHEICKNALTWNFSYVPEFANYKNESEKAFRNFSQCSKICMKSEYIKDDSSYFCKYYNWGSKTCDSIMANTTPKSSPVAISAVDESKKPDLRVFDTSVAPDIPKVTDPKVVSLNGTSTAIQTSQSSGVEVVIAPEKPEPKSVANEAVSPPTAQEKKDDVPVKASEEPTGQEDAIQDPAKNEAAVESPTPIGEQKFIDKVMKEEKPKETVVENPKPKSSNNFSYVDDDIDSDGEVGAEDAQIQDGDDSANADMDEQLNKPLKQENKSKSVQMIEPVVGNNKRIVMSPDVIEDDFPEEEEDHFFSFFLSAVVLIIVLYVLYHNKSKVNKVVLGLLVEGRQSGRRRNSRGHAYRRLDTLEQAISTNPTAAPTKIIY